MIPSSSSTGSESSQSTPSSIDWTQYSNLKISYIPPTTKTFSVFDLSHTEAKNFYSFVEDSYLLEKKKPCCPLCKTEQSYSELLLHLPKCVEFRQGLYGYSSSSLNCNTTSIQPSTTTNQQRVTAAVSSQEEVLTNVVVENSPAKKRKQNITIVTSSSDDEEDACQCCVPINKHTGSCAYQHNACSHIIQITHPTTGSINNIFVCKPKHYTDQNFISLIVKKFPKLDIIDDAAGGNDCLEGITPEQVVVLCSAGVLCNQGIDKQPKIIHKKIITVWGNPASSARSKSNKIYMSFCSAKCLISTLSKLTSTSSWNKMAKKVEEEGVYIYERDSDKNEKSTEDDDAAVNENKSGKQSKKKK